MKKFAVIRTTGAVELHEVSEEAESDFLTEAVGGWFQCVPLERNLRGFYLWCNEEGKLEDLPINPVATGLWIISYGPTDTICGDVVITGGVDGNGDTLGLSEAEIDKLEKFLELV